MSTSGGSTLPRRELGRRLKAFRNAAGVSMAEAAEQMERTAPTISRIEKGEVAVRSVDVEKLCEMYDVDPQTTADLKELAKETKNQDWWRDYRNAIPPSLDLLLSLERAATSFRWYEPMFVPGTWQTERYAEHVARIDASSGEEVTRRVRARMARQRALARDNPKPRYDVLLGEHVLTVPIPADVMAEQLGRLLEVSHLPHVSLRVVPFTGPLAQPHVGLATGPFNILEFPDDDPYGEPRTVHLDGWIGSSYLSKADEVAQYESAFAAIAEKSLDVDASRDLIEQRRHCADTR